MMRTTHTHKKKESSTLSTKMCGISEGFSNWIQGHPGGHKVSGNVQRKKKSINVLKTKINDKKRIKMNKTRFTVSLNRFGSIQ